MKKFKHITFGTTDIHHGNMALHTGSPVDEVLRNRESFSSFIRVPLDRWTLANQTHSTNIVEITQSSIGCGSRDSTKAIDNCDALYTREDDVLLGAFSADCLPILIYEENQDLICAIHSGWKASVQEYVLKVIEFLIKEENCTPNSMYVYFGPSIHQEHFEIKSDVLHLLQAMSFDTSSYIKVMKDGTMYADMIGINEHMVLSSGIPINQLSINPKDTFTDGFSYRKDKTINRHMSYIYKKSA